MSTPADPRAASDCEACGEPMAAGDVHEHGRVRVHRACAAALGAREVAALASEVPADPRDALESSTNWEWRPGMVDTEGAICVAVESGRPVLWYYGGGAMVGSDGDLVDEEDLPSDEPTLLDIDRDANHGHLLALVRRACPGCRVDITVHANGRASVYIRRGATRIDDFDGASLGLALAAALLAAPVKAGEP